MINNNHKKKYVCTHFSYVFLFILSQIICIVPSISSGSNLYDPGNKYLLTTPNLPWNITADHFSYNVKENTYKLVGNIIVKKEQITIKADSLYLNNNTMCIEATQGASIYVGENYLSCRSLNLNLEKETAELFHGSIFLQKNQLQISGIKIAKTGKDRYLIYKGFLTSCNSAIPAWSISGEKINIEKGKHGVVKNAVFRVKKIPIVYLPFILFPTENRQSGLLAPEITHTNKKISYCLPVFIKINEFSDITVYPHYNHSNTSLGLEYRYALNNRTKGLIMVDWEKNKRIMQSMQLENKPNTLIGLKRYWIRVKCIHQLPTNFASKIGIDLVSDKYYLRDHMEGLSGYNKTQKYFTDFINKSLSPCNESPRESYAILNKNYPILAFNIATYWNEDAIKTKVSENIVLPRKKTIIRFDSSQQKLFNSPFFFDVSLNHKNIKNDNKKFKTITIFKPRIYIPYTIKNLISMGISIGSEHVLIDHNKNRSSIGYINNGNFRLDLFSEFSRIFKKEFTNMMSLKHSVKIQTIYEYGSKTNYDTLVDFTQNYPKIYEESVSWSISNSLFSKSKNTILGQKNKGYIYRELVSFNLQQSFKKEKDGIGTFSDIMGELYLNLNNNCVLQTNVSWDIYNNKIDSHTSELYAGNNKNYSVALRYLYESNKRKMLRTALGAPLSKHIMATITVGYDCLKNKKNLESLNLSYQGQCWYTNISYKNGEKEDKHTIGISVELSGIGNYNEQKVPEKISLYRKHWNSRT